MWNVSKSRHISVSRFALIISSVSFLYFSRNEPPTLLFTEITILVKLSYRRDIMSETPTSSSSSTNTNSLIWNLHVCEIVRSSFSVRYLRACFLRFPVGSLSVQTGNDAVRPRHQFPSAVLKNLSNLASRRTTFLNTSGVFLC